MNALRLDYKKAGWVPTGKLKEGNDMKIRKAVQNYLLVTLLLIGSLVEAVSGFVLWFAFNGHGQCAG